MKRATLVVLAAAVAATAAPMATADAATAVSAGATTKVSTDTAVSAATLTKPSGVVAGDALVATITADSNPTVSTPSGWTKIASQTIGSGATQAAFLHVVGTTAEPASYSFAFSKAVKYGGVLSDFHNVDPTKPLDTTVSTKVDATFAGRSLQVPSISTVTPGAMLLLGAGADRVTAGFVPPAGVTEAAETTTTGQATALSYAVLTGTGATGDVWQDMTDGTAAGAFVAALRPGAGTSGGGTTTPPPATNTAMPVGDLPGWHQVVAQDFTKPAATGSFDSVYGPNGDNTLWQYDGYKDTSGLGLYAPNKVLSAHDGVMDYNLHTENGQALVAAPQVTIPGQYGQQYGRFSVRFKADPTKGYKTAFLLWPTSDNWSEGEIDYPEGQLSDGFHFFDHCVGNPSANCVATGVLGSYADWHVATIDWTPTSITSYLDGVQVAKSTDPKAIPTAKMRWSLQAEAQGGTAPAATAVAHVYVDWVTAYTRVG
jgi:hypothetical protein